MIEFATIHVAGTVTEASVIGQRLAAACQHGASVYGAQPTHNGADVRIRIVDADYDDLNAARLAEPWAGGMMVSTRPDATWRPC